MHHEAHDMPLPQRETFKKELDNQCEIGMLQKLAPEESDQAEWDFLRLEFQIKKDIR